MSDMLEWQALRAALEGDLAALGVVVGKLLRGERRVLHAAWRAVVKAIEECEGKWTKN